MVLQMQIMLWCSVLIKRLLLLELMWAREEQVGGKRGFLPLQ
jgi:hypothetical protein